MSRRGSSARMRAAPSADVARSARTSSTRGYSRTPSACLFTANRCTAAIDDIQRAGCSTPLSTIAADGRAFRASLELGITFPITRRCSSRLRDAPRSRRESRRRSRSREIASSDVDLGRARGRRDPRGRLVVHLDRLAALLDSLAQHLDHVIVGELALELDSRFLTSERCAEEQDRVLVLRLARRVQIALNPALRARILTGVPLEVVIPKANANRARAEPLTRRPLPCAGRRAGAYAGETPSARRRRWCSPPMRKPDSAMPSLSASSAASCASLPDDQRVLRVDAATGRARAAR